MTHAQRALDLLWSLAPRGAGNAAIAEHLGTTHQTAFMLTQDLMRKDLIRGEQQGRTWIFYAVEGSAETDVGATERPPNQTGTALSPAGFEARARRVLSRHYGVDLVAGKVGAVHKIFDLVSPDGQVVGDAKYYTRVGGVRLPPAKFATIAEHVWLLERTGATRTFLVFGNDREVPVLWLARYGTLIAGTVFFYLDGDGSLEGLWPQKN